MKQSLLARKEKLLTRAAEALTESGREALLLEADRLQSRANNLVYIIEALILAMDEVNNMTTALSSGQDISDIQARLLERLRGVNEEFFAIELVYADELSDEEDALDDLKEQAFLAQQAADYLRKQMKLIGVYIVENETEEGIGIDGFTKVFQEEKGDGEGDGDPHRRDEGIAKSDK